jgi:hypothetical protein
MSGPTYSGLSKLDLLDSAMSQPLSLTSTLFEEGKSGALESFGLGTLLRRGALPEEAPVQDGTDANGNAVVGTGDVYVPPDVGMRDALMGTWGDTPAQLEQRRQDAGALTEDQYKASPSFRKDIPYDPGMTETRAAALAAMDDTKKVREFYAQKRPIAAFLGSMAGQALDPINYVPVGGPLVKAAAIGRFGRIGGEALAASLDAAANTALFGIGTADARAQLGDDVSWQALISQIATAGLIGSAFGTIHGAIGARIDARRMAEAEQRLSTLQTTMESRIALNEGIDAIVRGEDVNLSPNATEPLQRVANDIHARVAAVANRDLSEFTVTGYHGTNDIIDNFDPAKTRLDRGVFFSTKPELANRFAMGLATDSDPVRNPYDDPKTFLPFIRDMLGDAEAESLKADVEAIHAGKATRLQEQRVNEAAMRATSLIDPETLAPTKSPNVSAVKIKPGKVFEAHLGDRFSWDKEAAAIEAARAGGYDTVHFQLDGPKGKEDFYSVLNKDNIVHGFGLDARPRVVDTAKPAPEPRPEGIKQAEASIAKPEDTKTLAAQHSVDPATGAFPEETEVAQLAAEGRLTPDDAATLAQAEADYHTGSAFAEALKSVAGCLL